MSDSDVRVTVRIEKRDGAPHEAVNGHADGDIRDVERLIESARKSAIGLALKVWLRSR